MIGLWYHFAIMFEALFILTISTPARASGASCCRMLWGISGSRWAAPVGSQHYFHQRGDGGGVGIFPVAGHSRSAGWNQLAMAAVWHCNQLLAAVALCVATTIIVKMGRAPLYLGYLGSPELAGRGDI